MKEFFRPLLYGIIAAVGAFAAIAAALWGPAGLTLTSSAYIWLAVGSLLPGAVAFLLEYRAGKDRLENKAALENLEKTNGEALDHWKEQITDANVDRGNTARLLSILGGAIMRIIYTSDPEDRSHYVGIFEQRLVELLRLALERPRNSSGGIRVIFLSKGRPSNQPVDDKLSPIIFYAQSLAGSNVNRTCVIRQSTRDETSAEEVLAQRGKYEYGLLVEAVNLKSADENPLLIADDGVMSYCRVAVRDPLVEHGILCVDSWVPNALGAGDREVIGAFAAILSVGLTLGSTHRNQAPKKDRTPTSSAGGEGMRNG
jgi:hypothetical protein